MNRKEILIDTNIVLYLLKGNDTLEEMLQGKDPHLSFITELVLVGFPGISVKEEKQINELLNDFLIISLNNNIKKEYIELRKNIA
jgi:predicted nucleic acid-binding protein